MKKLLVIGNKKPCIPTEGPFYEALKELGELTIIEVGEKLSEEEKLELMRKHHILLTNWGTVQIPKELADNPGQLEYICSINGSISSWTPLEIIESDIPVTNWGDAPANGIAEGAMTLLLATMKDLYAQTQLVREGGWYPGDRLVGGTLYGLHVGIYGMGVIARRFVELIQPFKPVITFYDPYISSSDIPKGCERLDRLEDLFQYSNAIVIHAGLSEETEKSVTAELLSLLPDQGIIINTARGDIIDQEALFAELKTGRLRAGLDVLAGKDKLEEGHPARLWENVMFTAHKIDRSKFQGDKQSLSAKEQICIDNIQRHIEGRPLRFVMDKVRFLRST